MEKPTPGKRQIGQVVPSVLYTISLGSRAGVQGVDASDCYRRAGGGVGWKD